ncbi:hypothetical protein [Nostoc sp.]|uniref:hypothetical protein n=1 Tax=Nostoc sp. TaxID=1180 RepID=UPI002FF4A573
MIVSYPAKIKDLGATRTQFTHITDITPTLLELTGIKHPERFNGKPTKPLEGISFAYLLNNANTPSQRTEQYYENSGNRGYYKDGWYAVGMLSPNIRPGNHLVTPSGSCTTSTKITPKATIWRTSIQRKSKNWQQPLMRQHSSIKFIPC